MRPDTVSLMRRAIRQAEDDACSWANYASQARRYAADAQRHRARLAALTGGPKP